MINVNTNIKSQKVMNAISAIKQKAEDDVKPAMEGVDLLSIVKKISNRRSKTK
jgi:hypothetical protein